jgi:hypothetical protein
MDENIIFIILIVVFIVFCIQKYPRVIAIAILVILTYWIYKKNFTSPRDLILYLSDKFKEGFEPCTMNNQAYCGSDTSSNMTILPDFLRSAPIGSIGPSGMMKIKPEDYKIDRRFKKGLKEITLDEIFQQIPILLDYNKYLEQVIKFTLQAKTDDPIQKDFLARKLRFKMTKIFYNAYNTVTDKIYPIQTYNELLEAQKEFNHTLDIFVFLALDDDDKYKLDTLQKEFNDMNKKLNLFVIEKVNQITPNDYNITSSRLPYPDEPQGISNTDFYI